MGVWLDGRGTIACAKATSRPQSAPYRRNHKEAEHCKEGLGGLIWNRQEGNQHTKKNKTSGDQVKQEVGSQKKGPEENTN